ncbi:MAG: hypothetical protein VX199_03060, partial [Chloroflexota bacterium]|nr:hypothetical protein [Chloroflexota bacterium]
FDGSTLAVTGAATISTTLGVTGAATFSSNLTMPTDNVYLRIGGSNDLQLWHDGTNSMIKNITGHLSIGSDNHIRFQDSGRNEFFAIFNDNGACVLYHDNAVKISTSASGVTVTGTVAMTGGPAAGIDTTQTFTKAQRGEIVTLSSASTVTIDMATSNNFYIALGHNVTFANPSNRIKGQSGSIIIAQDGTGGRTVSWGSNWDFIGGTAPTFTTTANATDRIDYIVRENNGGIHAVFTANYS